MTPAYQLPSYHSSYTGAKMVAALLKLDKFAVFSELSFKIEAKNYKPAVSLYSKRPINPSLPDTITMTEMPLLAIEILTPTETIQQILGRFMLYFEANVKSCWLVIPVAETVIVYSSLESAVRFNSGEITDEVLDIQILLEEIFD
jgi:Uma2 family endonuclease